MADEDGRVGGAAAQPINQLNNQLQKMIGVDFEAKTEEKFLVEQSPLNNLFPRCQIRIV